jgi:hypothetical protein
MRAVLSLAFLFACCAVALLLFVEANMSAVSAEGSAGNKSSGGSSAMSVDGVTLIVRLRSFAPRASGRLEVEPTPTGGRVRLTAVNLPSPQSLAPNARTFVVWASGGRIVRLGELRRSAGGSGSLNFSHPAEFARYSLVVTAEQSARAERPLGAPLFSTRANEVAALFPIKNDSAREIARRERRAVTTTPRTEIGSIMSKEITRPPVGEFYASINEALAAPEESRTLTLVGERGARHASGVARVATRDGTAYVRVRFRRIPQPARFGAKRYVLWASSEEDGTLFLRALPRHRLNSQNTYARRRGVKASDFTLRVTAEKRHPSARPRGRRILHTRD